MNSKRRALLSLILSTSTAIPAQAGCFDWLFGKPSQPYAVGFTPQPTVTPVGPLTPIGPPVITAPHAVGFAPHASGFAPHVSGFAPVASGFAPSYAGLAPAVAAQMPAYSAGFAPFGSLPVDNPSVLTGQPVMQTSAMQPSGLTYASPAMPPAAMTPPPQPSGVTSFFGKMLGNDYQSSYYNVPTTTYRPVTQVDPATGAIVTVQQPCTSTTQQIQRSPYASLQPATVPTTPYYGEPTCGGEPPRYSPPTTYGAPSPYAPSSSYPPVSQFNQPSGVSQATAIAPSTNGGYGYGATTIPSTSPYTGAMPYPSTNPQPFNAQPLSGYPGQASSDQSPLAAPQLDSMRPAWSSQTAPSASFAPGSTLPSIPPAAYPSTSTPSSGTMLEAPPLPSSSSSSWQSLREASVDDNLAGNQSLSSQNEDKYSDIPPIPATNEYQAPSWSEIYKSQNASQSEPNRGGSSTSSFAEPRTASSDNSWRYASSAAGQPSVQANELPALPRASMDRPAPKRDDSGWFVVEPR